MKKFRMNRTATLDETFADFLLSRRAKGLAEKTLESYSSQWKAVARHLDTGTDIAALQKADLDAMIVSMRDAGLSPNSINSYTRVLKSFFSWCNEQGLTRLNIPLYKAEETVKETYSDAELTALLKKPDIRKTTFAGNVQMAIYVGRHLDVAMPQPFLHILERKAVAQQKAGAAIPLRYNYDKPEKPRISRAFGYLARFFILFQTEKSSREVVIS